MKRSLIATVLGATLVLTAGVTPANATVLVQNKQPMVQSATLEAYKNDGWSSLPDYHMEVVSPNEIFSGFTQEELNAKAQDGIWLYAGACENTYAKWLYNWKGINTNQTIGKTKPLDVDGATFFMTGDYAKAGFNCAYLSDLDFSGTRDFTQLAKDALDRGCLVRDPHHAGIVYGYAEKDGKTWFAVLDTMYAANGVNACKSWESAEELMFGDSAFAIAKDFSVTPVNLTYNGQNVKAYMDKLGQYYYPLGAIAEIGNWSDELKAQWEAKLVKQDGPANTILNKNGVTNINNEAYYYCYDLKVVNGQIMLK